jgi:hypothetical protein
MQQQISSEEKQTKKPYQAPEMTELGKVEEVTQVAVLGSTLKVY